MLKIFQLMIRTVCLSDIFMLQEPTATLLANISQTVQTAHTELQHRGRDEAQESMWSMPHRRLHSIAQSLHNKTLKYSQKNGRRKLHITQTKCQTCRIPPLNLLLFQSKQQPSNKQMKNKWNFLVLRKCEFTTERSNVLESPADEIKFKWSCCTLFSSSLAHL